VLLILRAIMTDAADASARDWCGLAPLEQRFAVLLGESWLHWAFEAA
jgi:hypothetical protein